MPSPFVLSIRSQWLGKLVIQQGQGWLIQCNDSQSIDNFLNWIEGRKYYPGDSVELESANLLLREVYAVHPWIGILRFRLSENEGADFYYQQRYHSTENDNVLSLKEYIRGTGKVNFKDLAIQLGLDRLMDEKINMLSTGEFRKACLLKASISRPRVLFIEEPFTGIDRESRSGLELLFLRLLEDGISVVIFSSYRVQGPYLDHYLKIGDRLNADSVYPLKDLRIPEPCFPGEFRNAFELKNITAGYNGRDVLHKVNWTVRRYEKWKLTGPNGAGKSTLLSFVNADNPQAYSNEVYLFDRRRGTGESIWDIKDRIGYYSSEFHRYFDKRQTVEEAMDSIIFLNPYKNRTLNPAEGEFRLYLLEYFNLQNLQSRLLIELPPIIQKLVLLMAVFTKNAPLLILDEPFQDFNETLIHKIKDLLDIYIKDRTFIMVSHNSTEFPASMQRHFMLENGRGQENIL